MTAPHSRELAVAREAAAAASELLLGYFDKGVEAEAKGDRDLVSVADRDAEAVVRRVIAETFPDDLVVGEEGAEVSAAAAAGRRRWYVDPLDGTTNFLKGRRMWGVSIGFCGPDDRVHVGVVTVPRQGETYAAVRGRGATLDGRPLQVSATSEVRDALFTTGSHVDPQAQLPAWARVMDAALSLRVTGALAPDLCGVAAGESDGLWAVDPGPWDIAAGIVIAAEAGAVVTDLAGAPVGAPHVDGVVVAPPALHADLLRLLHDEPAA